MSFPYRISYGGCAVLLLAAVGALFWPELCDAVADRYEQFWGEAPDASQFLRDDAHVRPGFLLIQERNDTRNLSIQNLQVGAHVGMQAAVSFDLINRRGDNDFPALRLYLLNAQGQEVRRLDITANEYRHPDVFKTSTITLNLALRAGEVSYTVAPFYVSAAPQLVQVPSATGMRTVVQK